MGRELLEGDYIHADETPVGVQMHDGRGKNRQAYLWQYSRPNGSVVFDFRLGREREGPKRFLGNFEGILQSDGYGAYESSGRAGIVHAGCWAHARRKFFDAVKLNPKDQTAIGIVAQMDQLFAIDAQARASPRARGVASRTMKAFNDMHDGDVREDAGSTTPTLFPVAGLVRGATNGSGSAVAE
jgi:hypothetical protein